MAKIRAARRRRRAHTASRPAVVSLSPPANLPPTLGQIEVPAGRGVGALDRDGCARILRHHGVAFAAVDGDVPGVDVPIRLTGPINGVIVARHRQQDPDDVIDCRLAAALLVWSRALRDAGVWRVEHYSVYRAGSRVAGSRRPSGHAGALAIDAAKLYLMDGRVLDVLETWRDRRRGRLSCERASPGSSDDEALLRGLVCDAIASDVFQVVLTPHHNAAHENHIHLEVVPGVDWSFHE